MKKIIPLLLLLIGLIAGASDAQALILTFRNTLTAATVRDTCNYAILIDGNWRVVRRGGAVVKYPLETWVLIAIRGN
jgi:hypothetical protein